MPFTSRNDPQAKIDMKLEERKGKDLDKELHRGVVEFNEA